MPFKYHSSAEIFNTFDKTDFREFEQFLVSPFFYGEKMFSPTIAKNNIQCLQVIQIIRKDKKEILYKNVEHIESKISKKRYNRFLSNMAPLLREYLIQKNLTHDWKFKIERLAKECEKRNLKREFRTISSKTYKKLYKEKVFDESVFNFTMIIKSIEHNLNADDINSYTQKNIKKLLELQKDVSDNLMFYFLSNTIKDYVNALWQKHNYGSAANELLNVELLIKSEKINYLFEYASKALKNNLQKKIFEIYHYFIILTENKNNVLKAFNEMMDILKDVTHLLSREEIHFQLNFVNNFIVEHPTFDIDMQFNFYDFYLEHDAFSYTDKINFSKEHYKFFLDRGFNSNKIIWVKDFHNDFQHYLSNDKIGKQRSDLEIMKEYFEIRLAYAEKDYKKMDLKIRTFSDKSFEMRDEFYILEILCYYHLKDYDRAKQTVRNFEKFINDHEDMFAERTREFFKSIIKLIKALIIKCIKGSRKKDIEFIINQFVEKNIEYKNSWVIRLMRPL